MDEANTLINATIDDAFKLAEQGQLELAAHSFSYARASVVNLAPINKLEKVVNSGKSSFKKESEKYSNYHIKKNSDATEKLLIIADSLGLPRPNELHDIKFADNTYSGRIIHQNPNVSVLSLCQRFFTTTDAVLTLQTDDTLCRDAHVLIHLGLNDCANRMFLERERLALSLFDKSVSEKIVLFAQKQRQAILKYLPSHHYTKIETFRRNLQEIAFMARMHGAKSLTLTSIILPPSKHWPGTTGINQNFMEYNHTIAQVAKECALNFFDYDRHAWENLHMNSLLSDGMHLSNFGHNLFSEKYSALVKFS